MSSNNCSWEHSISNNDSQYLLHIRITWESCFYKLPSQHLIELDWLGLGPGHPKSVVLEECCLWLSTQINNNNLRAQKIGGGVDIQEQTLRTHFFCRLRLYLHHLPLFTWKLPYRVSERNCNPQIPNNRYNTKETLPHESPARVLIHPRLWHSFLFFYSTHCKCFWMVLVIEFS